jgi:hypothetical protein
MHITDLTYIEAGIHEELVAYEQEGVHVASRRRDGAFDAGLVPSSFLVPIF